MTKSAHNKRQFQPFHELVERSTARQTRPDGRRVAIFIEDAFPLPSYNRGQVRCPRIIIVNRIGFSGTVTGTGRARYTSSGRR
jgi:hypothetical protein